jgi:small subunit ribosomal protein S8
MLNDSLANTMSGILNAERIGKSEYLVKPVSKIIKKVMEILNKEGYVGKMEKISDAKGGLYKLHLLGMINKCGVVKPRFSVKLDEFEKFEKRYLPAKNLGIIIISTPKGMMTHEEAKEAKTGGRLLAYCY